MQLATQISQENLKDIANLAEKLDFIDILILRKFYTPRKDFPNDLKAYCFPLLYKEMKEVNHIKIGVEAFRKRVNGLVKLGLLEKVSSSNPKSYLPVKGKETFVRMVITKFFLLHGLTKFTEI